MSSASLIEDAATRAPYIARLLARDPGRLDRVAHDPYLHRAKPAAVQVAELSEWLESELDAAEFGQVLRRYRADELVRCGVRELAQEKPIEVGEELAHLADAALDAAIHYHRNALEDQHGPARYQDVDGTWRDAELVVIAMGKHGAEELNFASDIDIIYVYSSDAGDDEAPITLHAFFSELCRRVNASLGEVTDEDVVFRVDLRLRPEGSRGAIANSLPSLERYYESWGRPWERQAWLKARPCAGSLELGAEVMETMRPFVYPRSSSVDVIAEVLSLNRRIKAEQRTGGIHLGYDVKNGVGGIREIEFFVQALQLLWSPGDEKLRTRSTIGALDQLLFAGLVSEAERRTLGTAYRFMRHVEHLLQLESGRQTQRLPGDADALAEFATRVGFADVAVFEKTLEEHTAAVAALFASIDDDSPQDDLRDTAAALLAGTLEYARELELFSALGFAAPEEAHARLERARRLANSTFGRAPRGAAARAAPKLLAEMARSPDPDQAFATMTELSLRRSSFASIWRLIDEDPAIPRQLASLFGTSEFLSRQFIAHPELVGLLQAARTADARMDADELAADFADALAEVGDSDEQELWDTLAATKTTHYLRIGLADISGGLEALDVCTELSLVADETLRRAYDLTTRSMRERYGWPRDADGEPVRFSVIALGKLGGGELGYASDLDVVFVFSHDGESDGRRSLDATTYFTRLAQRLMGGLHVQHRGGRLYELDTRLRPLGSKGLLVSSLSGWRKYHQTRARLWERQALTKLRPVAGDESLGETVAEEATAFVYKRDTEAAEVARGVLEMRERIERELGGGHANLKVGRGGLVDIEFAAQYLQLVYGADHPALRTQKTIAVLEAAAERALADPDACRLLADGYRYLRSLEHRMRIVHDRSVAALPDSGIELDKLARRAGYARAEALTEHFDNWTGEIRQAFQAVVK